MIKIKASVALLLTFFALTAFTSLGISHKDQTTGSIKGKVRDESGGGIAGVTVTVRKGTEEVRRVTSDRKGDFTIAPLDPGIYTLVFRKTGLNVGTLNKVEVLPGKVRSLSDRLIMTVDEGTLAFVRGAVFNEQGYSVKGIQVEITRLEPDGDTKKIESKYTDETGGFSFRLAPRQAKYQVTVKADGIEPMSKIVEVTSAVVYNVGFTLKSETAMKSETK